MAIVFIIKRLKRQAGITPRCLKAQYKSLILRAYYLVWVIIVALSVPPATVPFINTVYILPASNVTAVKPVPLTGITTFVMAFLISKFAPAAGAISLKRSQMFSSLSPGMVAGPLPVAS
jgi:hypothetical protein